MELAFGDGDFSAVGRLEPEPELRLTGTAEASTLAPLSALLHELHQQLVTFGATSIRVDIRRLEFLNASCFNALVRWLAAIQQAPGGHVYQLRFAANPASSWQQRTLRVLSHFAPDVVVLEPSAPHPESS